MSLDTTLAAHSTTATDTPTATTTPRPETLEERAPAAQPHRSLARRRALRQARRAQAAAQARREHDDAMLHALWIAGLTHLR